MTRAPRWPWLKLVRARVRDHTISATAGHVAYVLAVDYVNGHIDQAWPSGPELAEATGRSAKTVRRALHELEHAGLLNVTRGHPASTSGNVYSLTNPAPETLPECGQKRPYSPEPNVDKNDPIRRERHRRNSVTISRPYA